MQSDIIYFGSNLADHFDREDGVPRRPGPIRPTPNWSQLVARSKLA